ncbi:gamma-glutamylcyclotransferase [Celeribacter indicus]|uniref:glutathione-specific gamma-glutamylcyclotransferase n=1 Tax=Celeribacter indicus TaxID=1208324 RepID=A0A0B5E7U9_9RHOB|nr:gamma-glutamylcyclotransferase [Celeribacter indicus]AJE48372.1 cation transport protein ChaC [Celeribacter indicus]SDW74176.1 cation transport protein ChaC [Celeribacter indicus]
MAEDHEDARGDMARGFWVFGYGSLIWNPGFEPVERVPATLSGFARSFCMWSIHHRGTPDLPGLVLALDAAEGGRCRGIAFRVGPERAAATLAELRERELVSSAYLERRVPLALDDGRVVPALAYVVDPAHVQYTGPLSLERQAEVIAAATGGRGPNADYLFNTASHLAEIGMEDAELTELAARVRTRLGL